MKVVSWNLWRFLKRVKPLVLYDVDREVFMEPMQGKLASSQFDLGHSDLFCVPELTSVFLSSGDSVFGDSLEFHQANRGSLLIEWENSIALHAMQGNRGSSRGDWGVSWVFSSCRRHLGYILELRRGCPF